MDKPSKNPLLDLIPLDDFEADDPLGYLTQPSIDRPPSPPPVWQDEIAGMFWDSGWDLRPYFKNEAWKSSIDMFVFDDKHWLNVYCKPLEFRLTRVNLRKLRLISKRHRCNHSILIYNGPIKADQFHFAKELNILISHQNEIGNIRQKLLEFVRDYPDSHD